VAVRAFPELKPRHTLAILTKFLDIAKACLGCYNAEHQDVHFIVHKRTRAFGYGLLFLKEPDGSTYYHLNFHAHDKKQKQRRLGVEPMEEDVTCCCPVSDSDVG
jgi:hypothetical protein